MNVLFILEDALRADRLGCYGYPKPTSPHLNRLAAEGVRFENTIAVSTHTFPPIVSMITGQTTATHGLMRAGDYDRWKHHNLWNGRRSPLHLMAKQGLLIDGELVLRWSPLGFERDTTDVEEYFQQHREHQWFFFAEPYPTHLPYNPPAAYYEMFVDRDYTPGEAVRKRMEIVRSRMIIHPPGVKSALEVGQEDTIGAPTDESHQRSAATTAFEPQDKVWVDALYDGEVRVFDDLVGRWIGKLSELGLLDDTLIIVTADHAEELLERGHIGHTSCNLKGTLFDECLRVPLIMRYPKKLPAGKVIKNQVSQIDIMPTIFHLLGLEMLTETDGSSLLPLINGATTDFRESAYAETIPAGWQALKGDNRTIWCLRTNEWKLILHLDLDTHDRRYELYNLRSDAAEKLNAFPTEKLNAFAAGNQKARELRQALDTYVSSALERRNPRRA